ncbi:MAG: RdgB/HAM1 family non-canonical purine NTP pyrophosphatase [Kiritimatiellae bacterium]|jgi:XTP/dITP diphosphohydrolase|nr:RdgB/HAM1 family non-canonical purine NTP pyrophosphatase [Kiritimatiellia bacterium]
MRLMIATCNKHKVEEIKKIFWNNHSLELLFKPDFSELPEVDEDQDTLEGNAIKKAVETAKLTGEWCLADDTGLEVDALDGAPGVYSARFAGEDATYTDNNIKLLKDLNGISDRTAKFACVIALSDPDGNYKYVRGECPGVIISELHGEEGFGYDPIFKPDGFDETFAQMSSEDKNKISHRGRALALALKEWNEILSKTGKRQI